MHQINVFLRQWELGNVRKTKTLKNKVCKSLGTRVLNAITGDHPQD